MQHEITRPLDLLNADGTLAEPGWARKPYWRYCRSMVKAPAWRLKEWDYYCVISPENKYGFAVVAGDIGYIGSYSVVWLDLATGKFYQSEALKLFPLGKTGLAEHSGDSVVRFENRKMRLELIVKDGQRRIIADCPGFAAPDGARGLTADMTLTEDRVADSMCIATSWAENRRAFYYNQKINCMPANGTVQLGGSNKHFHPRDAMAVLDWGRGVWTYSNKWYWGSASGWLNGVPFGWNIGYGFSDRTPASENMLFYNGKAHKLAGVEFHIDRNNYLAPWRFSSSDARFEMDFQPALDRCCASNFLVVKSSTHQVFGYYSGRAVLDDGRILQVEAMPGFAEEVLNRW